MGKIFGDALSCPHADYTILQETVLNFKCPKSSFRKEFGVGDLHDYAHLQLSDCSKCEHEKELKHYEIVCVELPSGRNKCKEVGTDS